MSLCSNRIISVTDARGAIYIGVWGTLRVQEQKFDISPWRDAYGDGQILVLVQRRGDEIPYEAADVTVSESGIATWTFTEADTAIVGEGKAALVYIVGNERVARTEPYQTYVAPTIGISDNDPQDPWADWYTRVLAASAAAVAAMGGAETAQTAAEAAQTASETAQGKAEDAQVKAEAAQTAAETAQTSAETAQGKAEAAQTAAETAQGLAETAQGLAETAQTAAAASASDALASSQTAQAWAEGKRGDADVPSTDPAYHNNAKYWSEQAAQTLSSAQELLNDLNTHRYDAFASETQSGESILHTDIGADGVPIKKASVTVTGGSGTVVLRHLGKNLFDKNGVTFVRGKRIKTDGTIEDSAVYAYSDVFIPVQPNTTYKFSGFFPPNDETTLYIAFYTEPNLTAFTRRLTGGVQVNPSFTTAANERYIVLMAANTKIRAAAPHTLLATYNNTAQLERGSAATTFAPYSAQDVTIPVDGAGTYTPDSLPWTVLGDNTFLLLPGEGITAKMSVTYRCDPTLAYDKLKAAIVAAGTT